MWEIGDRVAVTDLGMVSQENYGIEIKIGYKGTIINFLKVDVPWNPDEIIKFLVEFDESMGGHSGNGAYKGKRGHCWWFDYCLDKFTATDGISIEQVKRKNNFY